MSEHGRRNIGQLHVVGHPARMTSTGKPNDQRHAPDRGPCGCVIRIDHDEGVVEIVRLPERLIENSNLVVGFADGAFPGRPARERIGRMIRAAVGVQHVQVDEPRLVGRLEISCQRVDAPVIAPVRRGTAPLNFGETIESSLDAKKPPDPLIEPLGTFFFIINTLSSSTPTTTTKHYHNAIW